MLNIRVEKDCETLLVMASLYARMARTEIARLGHESPNSDVAIAANRGQRELLEILAEGFEQLSGALTEFASSKNDQTLRRKAQQMADAFSCEVGAWWEKNKSEAVDWCIRIPAIGLGITILQLGGASSEMSSIISGALIGGPKVTKALSDSKKDGEEE